MPSSSSTPPTRPYATWSIDTFSLRHGHWFAYARLHTSHPLTGFPNTCYPITIHAHAHSCTSSACTKVSKVVPTDVAASAHKTDSSLVTSLHTQSHRLSRWLCFNLWLGRMDMGVLRTILAQLEVIFRRPLLFFNWKLRSEKRVWDDTKTVDANYIVFTLIFIERKR